jgi:diguanylate cyclase (GGDEF)-like protein/PAS domain S-box-containing protein
MMTDEPGALMQLATYRAGLARFDHSGLRRVDFLLGLALLAYAALYLSWIVFRWGGEELQLVIADGIFMPLGALVIVIAVRAARISQDRAVRRAWWLFAASFAAYAFGDLVWFLIEVVRGQEVPTPSLADVGYLAFYPLLALGLLALPRTQHRSDRALLLDFGIVCTGCAAAIWWFVVGPVVAATGSDPVATLVALAYPVGDMLLLFALTAAVLGRVRGVPASVLILLGVGLLANALADLAYARLALEEAYIAGGELDFAYMVGWFALGLAGVAQLHAHGVASDSVSEPLTRPIPWLPYVATAVAFGLLLLAVHDAGRDLQVLVACTVLVTVLVSARQFITARQNARLLAQRLHSEARFAEILRNASDVVVVTDRNGSIGYATPSAPMLFGEPEPARGEGTPLVGRPVTTLVQPADAALIEELVRTAGERPSGAGPVACRSAADPPADLEVQVTNLLDNQLVHGLVLTIRDVSERLAFERELRSRALTDPLTGLANRVLFSDRLEQALHRAMRRRLRPAVLYLDLDGFKAVNDTLGHNAGDDVLVEVARRLRTVLRVEDTAARLGGDEFAVLIEDTHDVGDAIAAAERIRGALAEPLEIGGGTLTVATSIGIVRSESRGDDAVAMLRDADIAMYEAKRNSRGSHQIFVPRMYEETVERVRLEADMRVALDAGQLEVFYQPLVDLGDDRIVAFEALLRWHHPTRGLLMPTEFIPIAEACGEIRRIGLWVLEEACQTVGGWNRRGRDQSLRANVNISPRQLQPSFVSDVSDVLERTGFPPECLVLELTESAAVAESSMTVSILSQLRSQGIRIAIDDFGTGYSSLGYLRDLPVDELKIDRSFIQGKAAQGEFGLIATIIQLGRELSLGTVAEGIESPEQLAQLRELGCDVGQGYLLGRPAAPDSLALGHGPGAPTAALEPDVEPAA